MAEQPESIAMADTTDARTLEQRTTPEAIWRLAPFTASMFFVNRLDRIMGSVTAFLNCRLLPAPGLSGAAGATRPAITHTLGKSGGLSLGDVADRSPGASGDYAALLCVVGDCRPRPDRLMSRVYPLAGARTYPTGAAFGAPAT